MKTKTISKEIEYLDRKTRDLAYLMYGISSAHQEDVDVEVILQNDKQSYTAHVRTDWLHDTVYVTTRWPDNRQMQSLYRIDMGQED